VKIHNNNSGGGDTQPVEDDDGAPNPFARPTPRVLIKEKMEIVVRGVAIQSKAISGTVSVDNLTRGVEYYFEVENDYWANKDVIVHRINEYLPASIALTQEPEGLAFSVAQTHAPSMVTLYEYKANAKLIDLDTVPFVIAYRLTPGQLALKITFSKAYKPHIINFQLKIEFSEFLDPNEVSGSHMGTVIGKYYLIIFEQEELEPDAVVVQLSHKSKEKKCVNVKGMSSLGTSFASLQPVLTNLSLKTAKTERIAVLDVEYMLLTN